MIASVKVDHTRHQSFHSFWPVRKRADLGAKPGTKKCPIFFSRLLKKERLGTAWVEPVTIKTQPMIEDELQNKGW